MRNAFSAFAKTSLVLALLMVMSSCSTTPKRTTEERISTEVAEKLSGWIARRNEKCHTAALDVAVERADSMILEYARDQKLQLQRPSRPIRPEEPVLQRPNDTLKLAPFLGDTL